MKKKHKHKFKWFSAQWYGKGIPTGMMHGCKCGDICCMVTDNSFSPYSVKVIQFGKFHSIHNDLEH